MKRGLAFAFVALLSVCFAFAEGSYVVKSVKGSVRYEVSSGKLQNVKVGQTLSLSTYLNVGPNANVVLTIDGKDVTINGMKKDTLDKLLPSNSLKNSGSGAGANVASAKSGSKSGVNTASQRADPKSEELDWDDDAAEEEADDTL